MNRNIIGGCLAVLLAGLTVRAEEDTRLLDKELSQFETWIGIPHSTVKGLPEGTYQSGDIWKNGKPLGLNADVKKVFSVIEENGEPMLQVSGEIFGGLTTKKEYGNYHFSTLFKWGNKKWEPRLNEKFDSGILYHCYGEYGRFWLAWKTSIEFQVQQTDLGDFISLMETFRKDGDPGPSANVSRPIPKSEASRLDKPQGEWNRLEIYAVGNDSVHVVNGQVVQVAKDIHLKDGTPLTRGQIQIQSEGAECFYKDMTLTPIDDFPSEIKAYFKK